MRTVSHYAGPQVKLVKFLVNELVIDVSFETLGGLCAVNFLQDMDTQIARSSLFKRSIILVSLPPPPSPVGWCVCTAATFRFRRFAFESWLKVLAVVCGSEGGQ